MLTLGKITIVSGLEKRGLTLLDIRQVPYRSRHSSDVTVSGYSPSHRRVMKKTYRIMSVKPDTIVSVIDKNWY